MRNGLFGLVTAAVLASTLVAHGCSGSGSDDGGAGSGGSSSGGAGGTSPASGGSGGNTSQPPRCTAGESCGGDLVGTWKVTSSCLSLSGDMDVSLASLGCPTVPVTGSLNVTGTWTAKTGGSYTDNTTTTGSITFPLDTTCLTVSSVKVECSKMSTAFPPIGWAANCSTNGNGQCNCSATANQKGGIGAVSAFADVSGTYTTSGSGLNLDEKLDYSYCVSGQQLSITPKSLPVTGAIVFQKDGTSPGTGGATTGTGGKTGAGGATTGTGGATAGTGGKTGAGGATTGAGGATTSSGGRTGTGGATTGTGGVTTASGGSTGSGGTPATGGTTSSFGGSTGSRPCDIYAAANNACAAAHSTVRALFASYSGPLYQVRRASDKTTKDIGVASPGGLAAADVQDEFCKSTTCVIVQVYDQTKNGNHIGCQSGDGQCPNEGKDSPASATNESLNVGGQKVYALKMKPANAYWKDGSKSGMPTGSAPQGIYMVTSGKYYNGGCCFDYGNGPTSRKMSGGGTMDALYFGNSTTWGSGNGSGPWVMADLEGGIYAQGGGGKNNNVTSLPSTYVTAVEKNNGTTEFSLRGGDATTGNLATFYKGSLPGGYSPMKKQGAIILGSGGDCCYSNSNASQGTFYEGAIVTGYPSDTTDEAIQANVISAGYGK